MDIASKLYAFTFTPLYYWPYDRKLDLAMTMYVNLLTCLHWKSPLRSRANCRNAPVAIAKHSPQVVLMSGRPYFFCILAFHLWNKQALRATPSCAAQSPMMRTWTSQRATQPRWELDSVPPRDGEHTEHGSSAVSRSMRCAGEYTGKGIETWHLQQKSTIGNLQRFRLHAFSSASSWRGGNSDEQWRSLTVTSLFINTINIECSCASSGREAQWLRSFGGACCNLHAATP